MKQNKIITSVSKQKKDVAEKKDERNLRVRTICFETQFRRNISVAREKLDE